MLKEKAANVTGKYRLNRKNVPQEVKKAKLLECELFAAEFCGPKMENKGDILIVLSFQYLEIVTAKSKETLIMKPRYSP